MPEDVHPELLFTENETNVKRLYGQKNPQPYVKDAFHRLIVDGESNAINPRCVGTKCGAWYSFRDVGPNECAVVRFRLSRKFDGYLDEEVLDDVIEQRRAEADEFYWRISPLPMADDVRNVQRQALSGMLWTKQVSRWPALLTTTLLTLASIITSSGTSGRMEILDICPLRLPARTCVMESGNICTLMMSCPCPILGNTHSSQLGIPRSTAYRLP
jgi:hypothetical protein